MIAIDTNILVRVFIDDLNKEQVHIARTLVQKAKTVFLAQIVLVEMVWVFIRAYKLTKEQVLPILQEIHENAAFVIEGENQFITALTLFKENNIDFSDCMIFAATKAANVNHLYTFDSKFSKLKDVRSP